MIVRRELDRRGGVDRRESYPSNFSFSLTLILAWWVGVFAGFCLYGIIAK